VSIPILKQQDCLIASIQSVITDEELRDLRDRLVEGVGINRCAGVILDVNGMDVIDSFSVRTLRDVANMIRLRGAQTVIVGIQPEVAFTMVQLGLSLKDIPTALDLEEGMALLQHPRSTESSTTFRASSGTKP
jgi:rsbT antagonist protein RsbS